MRILDLARKDLTQILRDWKSALFLVIMPILFTVFFGLIFGAAFGNPGKPNDPRLPVGFINQDPGGLLSTNLESLLSNSSVIRPVVLEGEKATRADDLVAKGELAAVLRVPAGYSLAIMGGQGMSLEAIVGSTTAGRAADTALETIAGRLLGAVESAQISVQAYQAQSAFQDEASRAAYFQGAFRSAGAAWSQAPLTVRLEQATGQVKPDGLGPGNSGFAQASAGMIVQFAIFGLISSGMILVLERKNGAMARLLTTPISRVEVIAGHILAMFLVIFGQEALLVIVGQFAFGVDYLRQPGPVVLMMVVLALWAASLGLLISALCRTEDQVIVVCLIAMFVFSALGGAWFPLEVTGKAFNTIGHLLPTAWAMDGFQNIILRGQGFNSVVMPASILVLYAALFFALAVRRFRFE